jgi:hypothetical protein
MWKRCIALCGELALEEAMDLSDYRQQNEVFLCPATIPAVTEAKFRAFF